eukprot:sb/3472085/
MCVIRLLLFTAALCGTVVLTAAPTNWTARITGEDIYLLWDLETTPLQIKTDSTVSSDEEINDNAPLRLGLDLPVQPPVEVDKIWMISKTETALIITCNDVEVLNYVFADSSENCEFKWGGDKVDHIGIYNDYDTASDFYRAGTPIDSALSWNRPIRTLYLGHMTGYQPISDQ